MWAQRDPIMRLRRHLILRGLLDDAQDAALEEGLMGDISAAVQEIEQHGPPARETLFDDVYANLPWHLVEQRAEMLAYPPQTGGHGGH